MMELNSKIKDSLIKIDFVKRYEKLSNRFNAEKTPSSNRLIYIDGEEVMDIIQDIGYRPQFNATEKFYKIQEEKIGQFVFGVHIILQDGTVELVWVVKENNELLLEILDSLGNVIGKLPGGGNQVYIPDIEAGWFR